MFLPFGELKKRGWDVTLLAPPELRSNVPSPLTKYVMTPKAANIPDVLVHQRCWHDNLLHDIQILQSRGCKIIHEFDDGLHNMPNTNPSFRHLRNDSPMVKTFTEAIKTADVNIVSTPQLRDFYRKFNPHVEVAYNCVDDGIFAKFERKITGQPKREGQIRIGWGGSNTHQQDLETALPALIRVMREFDNVRFGFIGWDGRSLFPSDLHKRVEDLGRTYPGYPKKEPPGGFTLTLDDVPDRLPSVQYFDLMDSADFDIAIAPLERNTFNSQKSFVKFLEYGALNLPIVATAHGPYRQYAEEAKEPVGLLCSDTQSWYKALVSLIGNAAYRAKLAEANRRNVAARHLISREVVQWERVLESLRTEAVA